MSSNNNRKFYANTSDQLANDEGNKLTTVEISDDEDFYDTKLIPIKKLAIKRSNNVMKKQIHEEECVTDDDNNDEQKMESTDDSFSPPTLANGLQRQQQKSSMLELLQPQKLYKLSSGIGITKPNADVVNADKLSNKKSSRRNDIAMDDVACSSCSNPVNIPKLPPRSYFRWGTEKPKKQVKSRVNVKKRSKYFVDTDIKKRNIHYENSNNISDEDSDITDDNSCDSNESAEVIASHKLMIAGVNVEFPLKPYSSQIAVMNGLIRGCTKEEHALLESPTGSGKTLALLCGALAWQKQYAEKCAAQYDEWLKQQNNTKSDDVMMDFNNLMGEEKVDMPNIKKVPKIYYGSRTHRQISQVVKELGRTAYAGARMTILSSRDFACIQNTNRNKTELCNELLDPIRKLGCPYYNEDNRRLMASYSTLSKMSFPSVWDIEDLFKLGQNLDCCPYYAARNLMTEADIIFCPYNYLIDPFIRQSMQIDLKGDIIILDEAHNIEDICRDSASMTFRIDELNEVVTDCMNYNKGYEESPPAFSGIVSRFCERLKKFIEITNVSCRDNTSDQMTSNSWSGPQFVEMLRINELDITTTNIYKKAAKDAIEQHTKAKDDMRNPLSGQPKFIPTLNQSTIRILECIIFSIDMITSSKHANDYRVLIKEIPERSTRRDNPFRTRVSNQAHNRIRVLQLLCLNPGVIFTPLAETVRTIAVASGTLAPTLSFASELMTKFPNMLHASHVVSKEQVFVRAISQGPMNIPLKATYANVNSWKFQDELGRVILDVCKTVPYGILCFFSSYTSMKNLTDRWKQNGIMSQIEQCKYVMEEPRVNSDLAEVMTEYREKIRLCSAKDIENNVNGVLLFAVFRGKVAEGIDFSDNEARCVLTIGIPYAVRNDPAVELKISYNDLNTKEKNVLKGGEWYTIQAYRALNQALGRCIRHRNDWGAILLVDERFLNKNNQSYLPNWIKSMWTNRNAQYNLRAELEQFVADRLKADSERITKPV